MTPRRARLASAALLCLFAAFATAAAAHVVLGLLGDAYAEREHVALGPIALAAAGLLAWALLRITARAWATAHRADPWSALAAQASCLDQRVLLLAAFAGGLATLLSMETIEQLAEHGTLATIDAALGGNVPAGLAVVALLAAAIVNAGARCARLVATVAIRTARAVAALTLAVAPRARPSRRRTERTVPHRAIPVAFLARCSGFRAPPHATHA